MKNTLLGKKYLIESQLGQGGMGIVYLAHDQRLQRKVAIKVLKLDKDLNETERKNKVITFEKEAVAIANLNHPNIVNVYDIGEDDKNTFYIVMEVAKGKPLSELLLEGKLSQDKIIDISIQISKALNYIHKNNVIHRDIKPENIIYSEDGIAKLTDFGISKTKNTNENVTGILGTILYISPEQLQFPNDVDGRSDIYSLGVSIYELLTGKNPFQANNVREAITKIVSEIPISPSKINLDIPEDLAQVIFNAIKKDKNKRYSNAEELIIDLCNIENYKHLDIVVSTKALFESKRLNKEKALKKIKRQEVPDVDLTWLDNLGHLMKQEEQIKVSKSQFANSFSWLTPIFYSDSVKNTILNLSKTNNIDETINILKYFYSDKSIKDIIAVSNETRKSLNVLKDCSENNLVSDNVSKIINNLNFNINISNDLKSIIKTINSNKIDPQEMVNLFKCFLSKMSLQEIVNQYIFDNDPELNKKMKFIFNLFFSGSSFKLINFKLDKSITMENIRNLNLLIGDILVSFGFCTRAQVDLAMKKKEESKSLLGDILINLNYIKREDMDYILKIQKWYKNTLIKSINL